MANLRNTVVTGSLRLASHGAGMVRTDANGTISTAAMTAGDLPSHNHDDRYYTESESDSRYLQKDHNYTYGTHDYCAYDGQCGWHKIAEVTLNGNCQSYNFWGEYRDLGYSDNSNWIIGIVARAECDFTSNNESHYLRVNITGLTTNDTSVQSKLRVVLAESSSNRRVYELQFNRESWDNGVWKFRHNGGFTLYSERQNARTALDNSKAYYVGKTVGNEAYYDTGSISTVNVNSIWLANAIYGGGGNNYINYGTNSGFYTNRPLTVEGRLYLNDAESINLYGIRGRFTNEYIHLYNKVGVGHPSGWGQGQTNTPQQGLSTYGAINIAYGSAGSISYFNGPIHIYGTGDWSDPDLVVGSGNDGSIRVRHIHGKRPDSNSVDALWLNYSTGGQHVQIGSSGEGNNLYVAGNVYVGGYFAGDIVATRAWVQAQGYRTTDSDNQTLSVSGTTLSISGGNSVTLPTGGISQGDADARYLRYTGAELAEGNYFYFRSNRGSYLGGLDSATLQVYATGGNSAFMSFHRSGNYAVNFGLDADNVMRIGGWSASSDRWVLDMSGNNTVASSFRAPIFYDSQDTSYYVDPNSNSRLVSLNLSNGQVNAANNAGGRLRISSYTNGESVINGNTHNIVLGPYSTRTGASLYYAGIAINGLMNYSGSTAYDVAPHIWIGGYYRDTPGSERSDFVVAIKSGTGTSGAGSDLPEPRFRVDYEGIATATGSFRAPIFYDSNDTTYYLDPNSSSRLRYLYVGDGGSNWSNPGGWDTTLYISGINHSIIRVENRQNNYQSAVHSHTGQLPGVGSPGDYDFRITRNWSNRMVFYTGYTYAEGYLQAADSLRAPIFYDSNDTSYYLDPNSTSRIASLQVNRHIDAVTGWGNASNVLFLNWDGRKVVLGNNNNGWHDLASALGQDQIITTNRHWFPQGIQPLNMGGSVLNLVTSNIGTASGNREAVTFIDGSQVQAHVSVGTGSGGNCYQWYNTEWLIVDPEKDYEFSVWVKSSGHHNIYLGWHELNGSWSQITSNPYFHTGTYNTQGGWIKIVAKLRNWRTSSPQGDDSADRWASTNSKTSYANDGVMHSSTRYVHLRMGTCYGDGSANKTYFHLVSVREITGHDQYAQSIAMPYFNGLQTAGTMYLRSQTHWDNYSGIDVIGGSGEFRISSDSGSMSVRVDGSFIASDNVYLGARGVWLSDWLNQSLTTSSGPTFGNVYTSGWFRNYGQQGIYNQDYGVHFYAQNSSAWSITGSGGNVELQFRSNHNSTVRGYVYADTSNQIGFLHNGGGWNFRTTSDKNAFIHGQALTINADNAGWSSIYMNDGDEGMREIHCNSNRIGFLNQSGSWGSWCDDSGNWVTNAGMYAAAFYDQDNSAYYGNFASTSRLNGIYADYIGIGQDINTSYRLITNGSIYLNSNGNGWAEGVWKQRRSGSTFYDVIDAGNIGSQSVSYASTSYIVNSTNDYRHSNRSPDSWHGLANSWHFNDSSTLGVSGSDYWTSVLTVVPWYGYASSHRQQQLNFGGSGGLAHRYAVSGDSWSGWSRIYSDAYRPYADSAGNADTVDGYHSSNFLGFNGNSYYQASNWIQLNGVFGLYAPGVNGAHWMPNTNSTYTTWRIAGSRNGYSGFYDDHSAVNGAMYDGSGNGGVYREANGRWYWYHHVGNNCTGISTSTTSSSYRAYIGGSLYAEGDIVAYSDRRKKTDIITIDNALEKVTNLRGVYYTRIDDPDRGRQTGVIAQEINEILPEVVTYAADVDEYGVSYGNIVGVLIEAIKEQQKQIEELKAKLV